MPLLHGVGEDAGEQAKLPVHGRCGDFPQALVSPLRNIRAGDRGDGPLKQIMVPYERVDPDLLPSRAALGRRYFVGVALQSLGHRYSFRSEEHTSELKSIMRL